MTVVTIGVLLVAGWLIGILVNYLADVLPRTRGFGLPICSECRRPFKFFDYGLIRPCRGCNHRRARRAWTLQLLAMILVPVVWFFPPDRFGFWVALLYFTYFAVVFVIDVEHRVILHPVSLVGAVLVLPLGITWNGVWLTLAGGAAGFAIMFILYYFGILFNKFLAKRRGQEIEEVALGFGDVNLSAVLGIMLGWPKIVISLFFSVILGGIISGLYLLFTVLTRKYQAFTAIPYAPFLIIAAVILFYLA